MPNAQLTPCQSSFRCRCARLIRSPKMPRSHWGFSWARGRARCGGLVSPPLRAGPRLVHSPSPWRGLCTCCNTAATTDASVKANGDCDGNGDGVVDNWQRLALALLLIKKFHSPRAFPCHPFPLSEPSPSPCGPFSLIIINGRALKTNC